MSVEGLWWCTECQEQIAVAENEQNVVLEGNRLRGVCPACNTDTVFLRIHPSPVEGQPDHTDEEMQVAIEQAIAETRTSLQADETKWKWQNRHPRKEQKDN